MHLFDQYLDAERAFFASFGYYPNLNRYPERHPILDCRQCHWLVVPGDRPCVCWSVVPLSGLRLEMGAGIHVERVLRWLGANSKTGARGGVWQGHGHTLFAGTPLESTDRRYLLFADEKLCRNPFLTKLARSQLCW
jgi:hypothetical protein